MIADFGGATRLYTDDRVELKGNARVLAETRAKVAILRPPSIGKIDLTAA